MPTEFDEVLLTEALRFLPEGYAIVPIKPTGAMVDAARNAWQSRVREKVATGTIGHDPDGALVANYVAMVRAVER